MRVAVVGSGVSGLGAAWALNEHSNHEVHVYEADDRPGGHANTVQFTSSERKNSVPVDTGFVRQSSSVPRVPPDILRQIVLNPVTYPNLLRFLKAKNVPLLPTEMTFSVSRDKGKFEWAGDNLFTIFCQPTRILDPQMWTLIYDVLRFNACSREILSGDYKDCDVSIGQYLEDNGYSSSFRDNYLVPMTAAVWSTSPDKCTLGFPARTLIQFLYNHHLLQITGKPSWLTIHGGRVYVDKITEGLRDGYLHLSTPVISVQSLPTGKVEVSTSHGEVHLFDHVILACHSDTALRILRAGNISADEERVLGKFGWNKNEVVLHSDVELMPKTRTAWSCWNYLSVSAVDKAGNIKANVDRVSLTYWMNDLQHLSEKHFGPVLVTLNPPFEPRKETIVGRWSYDHPILDNDVVAAQNEMSLIQNKRGISFAGAWLKYGFHEDGFTSGVRVAVDHLGVVAPFEIQGPDRKVFQVWLAHLFSLFEASGARTVLGLFLSSFLYLLRLPIGLFLDLSHITS